MLSWLLNGEVVDGGTLLPGKELVLQARGLGRTPGGFEIYRVYSPAFVQVREFLGLDGRLQHVASLDARRQVLAGSYRSDQPWRPAPPPRLSWSAAYMFRARGIAESSALVHCTPVGRARLNLAPGSPSIGPDGWLEAPVESVRFTVDLFAPGADPSLKVAVLQGPALARQVTEELDLEFAAHEGEDREFEEIRDRLASVRSLLLDKFTRAYSGPEDWEWFHDAEVEVGPGAQARLGLEARPWSEGTCFFAVRFEDTANGGAETSDIWALKAERGRVLIHPDVSTIPLPWPLAVRPR